MPYRSKPPMVGRPVAPGTSGRPGLAKPEAPAQAKFVAPENAELITMKPPIVVRVLADMVKRKPFQLIGDLMGLGVFANVNQSIEESVAQKLCAKYGFRFEVEKRERGGGIVHAPVRKQEVDVDDKIEDLKPRPPVVTIMGHVDHGKTTLLDVIRKSNVAAGEAGGITQHIGAYTISFPHPERPKEIQQITFLDTPGHAAFSAMRARGANVTDIVVLVVASNDGVMPQTIEAINHAAAAKVQIIVAVNKCDHPNANPMMVRQQLQEHGLVCEEWGGTTIFQDISALTKKGVDKLLELILLQAEIMELKANPDRPAKGNVIESGLEPGGPTATVLVRKGTLRVGDIILCGPFWGKARALISEEGKRLPAAGPSVAVKLLGLNGVPEAGVEFAAVESEKMARELGEQRAQAARERGVEDRPKITLENLFATLSPDMNKVLKIVVKADTQGSVEAIVEALKKIDDSKVTLDPIHSAVGIITESDVLLASASKAIVLGFHTRIDSGAADAAKQEGVQIKLYSIIYELIDQVKEAMAGLLEPVSKEVILGAAEVRKIFPLSKGGNVAGCMVTTGRIVKGRCRVLRRKDLVYEGLINSIRRFQDETNEVRAGLECGIRMDGFNDYQTGDSIESYVVEKVAQKL
jgi:translation initiation factor IF-2